MAVYKHRGLFVNINGKRKSLRHRMFLRKKKINKINNYNTLVHFKRCTDEIILGYFTSRILLNFLQIPRWNDTLYEIYRMCNRNGYRLREVIINIVVEIIPFLDKLFGNALD